MRVRLVPGQRLALAVDHMLDAMHDLVVEDVEAHRRQGHARHDVNGAEPQCRGRVFSEAWHQVAEADCRQRHEAEVDAVEHGPIFEAVEDEGADDDVHDHHAQTQADGRQDAETVHRRRVRLRLAQRVDFGYVDGRRVLLGRVHVVLRVIVREGPRSNVVRLLQC